MDYFLQYIEKYIKEESERRSINFEIKKEHDFYKLYADDIFIGQSREIYKLPDYVYCYIMGLNKGIQKKMIVKMRKTHYLILLNGKPIKKGRITFYDETQEDTFVNTMYERYGRKEEDCVEVLFR